MTKEIIAIALTIISIAVLVGSRLIRHKINKEMKEETKAKTE